MPVEPPKPITNSIGMKLVLIPAGEFLMGSPDSDKDAQDDEKPQHRVRITRPFYLGATEVTQGQYRAVTGQSPSYFKGSDDLPVEQVSWNDAIAFCNKLSEREGWSRITVRRGAVWRDGTGCRRRRSGSMPAGRGARPGTASATTRRAWASLPGTDGNSGGKTHPVGREAAECLGSLRYARKCLGMVPGLVR